MLPKFAIGASYGDALISAQLVGAADESTSWMQEAAVVKPNRDNEGLYTDMFGRYLELYPATKDVVHFLAGLQLGG